MSEAAENEPATEQVFDYFLKELVSGQSPPNLSARIATAWAREQEGLTVPTQLVQARPVRRGQATEGDPNAADAVQPRHGTSLRRNVIATLLALGACGLLALLSWRLVEQDRDLAQRLFELAPLRSQAAPSNQGANQTQAETSKTQLAANGQPSAATDSDSPNLVGSPANQSIDGQSQPFPLDRGLASRGSLPVNSAESTANTDDQPLLDSQQIVAQIDQRLAHLWQGLSLTPSERLNSAERAQRISLVLTGQPAVQTDSDLEQLITGATDSLPFARKWAEQFVALWLADSRLSGDDARLQALKKHFANNIYDGLPWNTAPGELLSGTIASDASGQDAITSTFVSALAGDGNHRMVAAIGHGFLDVNLSCVRCHEASSPASAIEGPSQTGSPAHIAERQAVYWSLTAMLQGIDAQASPDGTRVAVDRQAELLAAGKPLTAYYDLLDGRLQVAEPGLPDGQAWQSMSPADGVPRQALAEWLSQSSAVDAATVNQVWKMVFGQALVSHAPWQSVASAEQQMQVQQSQAQRSELQQLLAQQYRAHGHDLKQLVGWIVRSDALRRRTTQPNRAQWLAASAEQLQQWQLAQTNFATGAKPVLSSPDASLEKTSLERTLLTVLQWREQPASGSLGTTLAQPVPSSTPANPPQSSLNTAGPSGISDNSAERHHLNFPSASDIALVEQLLASKRLSWENCVEHVGGLTPQRLPDGRFQALADELLRHHNGDARATLLDLLWAVEH